MMSVLCGVLSYAEEGSYRCCCLGAGYLISLVKVGGRSTPSTGRGQSAQLADTEPGSVPCESLAVAQCDHLSVVTLAGVLGRDKPA